MQQRIGALQQCIGEFATTLGHLQQRRGMIFSLCSTTRITFLTTKIALQPNFYAENEGSWAQFVAIGEDAYACISGFFIVATIENVG